MLGERKPPSVANLTSDSWIFLDPQPAGAVKPCQVEDFGIFLRPNTRNPSRLRRFRLRLVVFRWAGLGAKQAFGLSDDLKWHARARNDLPGNFPAISGVM